MAKNLGVHNEESLGSPGLHSYTALSELGKMMSHATTLFPRSL